MNDERKNDSLWPLQRWAAENEGSKKTKKHLARQGTKRHYMACQGTKQHDMARQGTEHHDIAHQGTKQYDMAL